MKTVKLVENDSTSGDRFVWEVWDGSYQVATYPVGVIMVER